MVRNGKAKTSIIDINYNDNYQIYVFQGKLSPYDIIIKYSEKGKRIRTPKHIHWVVDSLMKLQGNKVLMHLLMYQEKTNREDAYMFGKILTSLLKEEIDIFSIVSIAGYNGR